MKSIAQRFLQKTCIIITLALFAFPTMASVYFIPQNYNTLPEWQQSRINNKLLTAIKASCQRNLMLYPYYFQSNFDIRGELPWMISCQGILNIPAQANSKSAKTILETYFQPYLVVHNFSRQGLFTGYYLPEIKGSLTKTPYYQIPIYAMPQKKSNIPYREQINAGMLPDAQALAWIHNPVDLYFMQVQGSGKILLPKGQSVLLGYAGQNGFPYYPIGRFLKDIGATKPKGSIQTLESWLNNNPAMAQNIMNIDASYVFFKILNTPEPLGAEKIPLTPGHSLAVDTGYIPLGTPIWLSSFYPSNTDPNSHGTAFTRMMVAQDTGGAINGPIRGDIYWGSGARAKDLASHLASPGTYWVLLPTALNTGIMNDKATLTEF
jgi:membrane-bound lytic murein transglycosylase A